MLRPKVSRLVRLGVKSLSGAQDQISVTVRQSWVCWCGAPSLTGGRVCRLQLLLVLARAVDLGSESRGTHDHILLFQIRDSLNAVGQFPVFIAPRNRVAQLYPQALGSLFIASYDSQGCGGSIRTRLHRDLTQPKPKLLYDSTNVPLGDAVMNLLPSFLFPSCLRGHSLTYRERPFLHVSICPPSSLFYVFLKKR
jgi:hypothetical protein